MPKDSSTQGDLARRAGDHAIAVNKVRIFWETITKLRFCPARRMHIYAISCLIVDRLDHK